MTEHGPCCGCPLHKAPKGLARREFLATVGASALAGAALAGCVGARTGPALARAEGPVAPVPFPAKPLVVQPAISYRVYARREKTSWRPWGAFHSMEDIDREVGRIQGELDESARKAGFPIEVRPVARVTSPAEGQAVAQGDADVMLMYGANGDGADLEALISPDRHNLLFLRHASGPVYLWYEIASPRLLRKTVDELGQPGLEPRDVVVDDYAEVLWRLRALFALKNTLGSRIVAIGGASGWGLGGRQSPRLAADKWKLDIAPVSYDDLAKRIKAARADAARIRRAEEDAAAYLRVPDVRLETARDFVSRAFLLTGIFEELMAEHQAPALTVNECMSTIIPMAETTACMPLMLINDAGAMAFCESDFAVIPSGILLHHIAQAPVFLQDPTYPHNGIVTVAHCTAPRRMDGARLEKAALKTHYESDYGAAPKVEMRVGQTITMVDPDFNGVRCVGFRGSIVANPCLDICRSQVDVAIEGDCAKLAETMCGFHWNMVYGDYRKEVGYALHKLGIEWVDLTELQARRA